MRILKDYFKRFITPFPNPEQWLFLVGCYNSGTSLLHTIVASHNSVASMPSEGQFFTKELPLPKDLGYKRSWALAPEKFYLGADDGVGINVRTLKMDWAVKLNDPSRSVIVEKSPTNAARIKWLNRHFSNAHFIAIVRNGYAVAEGIHRKTGLSLQDAARQWDVSNRIMLKDIDDPTIKSLLITYEELTDATSSTLQRISQFVGLEFDWDAISKRVFRVHGQDSLIRNMNSVSFKNLDEGARRIIEHEAAEMLHRFGYGAD